MSGGLPQSSRTSQVPPHYQNIHFATGDFVCVGYRGPNPYDAGMFYCPYVPLTMVKAVGENDFQPRIGFKTRYGMVANPFVAVDGIGSNRANQYYRIFRVDDMMKS